MIVVVGSQDSFTHLHGVVQEGSEEPVDVFLRIGLCSDGNMVDHLLHHQCQKREGSLEHVDDLVDIVEG